MQWEKEFSILSLHFDSCDISSTNTTLHVQVKAGCFILTGSLQQYKVQKWHFDSLKVFSTSCNIILALASFRCLYLKLYFQTLVKYGALLEVKDKMLR